MDAALVYFDYSRGFKSGGFNGRGGTAGSLGPFEEEIVDAFEIGLKADWLDSRLRTNLALFRGNYEDLQRTIIRNLPPPAPNPQETVTDNAASATIQGVELEVAAVPLEGLELNMAVGFLDAGYDKFLADLTGSGVVVDNSGIPLQRAPEWTVSGGASYVVDLAQLGSATVRLDYNWVSEQNNHAGGIALGEIGPRGILDFSTTWTEPEDRYHLTFFLKNATDKVYQASVTPVGRVLSFNHISQPRRWGIEIGWDL